VAEQLALVAGEQPDAVELEHIERVRDLAQGIQSDSPPEQEQRWSGEGRAATGRSIGSFLALAPSRALRDTGECAVDN
jgi:hypothetical protein